jgi:hypothetical protein
MSDLIADRADSLVIFLLRLKLRQDVDEFANPSARQWLAGVQQGIVVDDPGLGFRSSSAVAPVPIISAIVTSSISPTALITSSRVSPVIALLPSGSRVRLPAREPWTTEAPRAEPAISVTAAASVQYLR